MEVLHGALISSRKIFLVPTVREVLMTKMKKYKKTQKLQRDRKRNKESGGACLCNDTNDCK